MTRCVCGCPAEHSENCVHGCTIEHPDDGVEHGSPVYGNPQGFPYDGPYRKAFKP